MSAKDPIVPVRRNPKRKCNEPAASKQVSEFQQFE